MFQATKSSYIKFYVKVIYLDFIVLKISIQVETAIRNRRKEVFKY